MGGEHLSDSSELSVFSIQSEAAKVGCVVGDLVAKVGAFVGDVVG